MKFTTMMIGGQQEQQHLVRATSPLETKHIIPSAKRTMKRRGKSRVGNGVDRGHVDVVVDGAHKIPPMTCWLTSTAAAAVGNAKMEHHQ